jgi:O-antigen/teichoic acid export membrane protein
VFALAYDLVHQVLALASASAGGVVAPVLAKSIHDRERVRRLGGTAARSLLLITMPVALALASASPDLGAILYGDRFSEVDRYMVLLAPAVALELGLNLPATAVLLASNATLGAYLRLRVATILLFVLYPVVGFDDLMAVLVVLVIVRVSTAALALVVAQRRVGVMIEPRWWLFFFVGCVAAAGAGMAAQRINGAPLVSVVLGPLAVTIIFGAAIRTLGLLGPDEAALARRLGRVPYRIVQLMSPRATFPLAE